MHKSWGNAIEFDEAAERMGVDVMRWMYASARPDDNILFGWHAADEARRGLLVLWNVYAFFVTYARLAGWGPAAGSPPVADRPPLDRWILSRSAGVAAQVEARLRDYDAEAATRVLAAHIDDLSTWYLRLSRRRMSRGAGADRDAAFATLHQALVALARTVAPILPFLSESMYANLVVEDDPAAPDSVHLTRWPVPELAPLRDEPLEEAMAVARRAVDLSRTLRGQAGLKMRQPLARLWLALPGRDLAELDALLELVRVEANVKVVELIGDESELVDRGVKVLLPRVGRRLGAKIPEVMAAARGGQFEIHADGTVTIADEILAADEVEIQATPRPGTAVAHDDGLVAVIDTTLTPELLAEGDARELTRAVQDLRKEAELDLDDRIVLWADGIGAEMEPFLASVTRETLADELRREAPPSDLPAATVRLERGEARIALRRIGDA
jgi:isoleucyl-tRNA synthetase